MIRLTPLEDLRAPPRRVILHWTGGRRSSTSYERTWYNLLLEEREDDAPRWVPGVPVDRNMARIIGTPPAHRDPMRGYAAHTGGFNSFSIGVAVCGMADAWDYRPTGQVDPGLYPITRAQVEELVRGLAVLLQAYGLEPVKEQLFDHWEAEHLHGVRQRRGVWDLQWLPGLDLNRGDFGFWIRERVAEVMAGRVAVSVMRELTLPPEELARPKVSLRRPDQRWRERIRQKLLMPLRSQR